VTLRNFWSSYLLMGNLALIALIAASVTGAAYLATLTFKHQPLLRHDVAEWLGRRGFSESSARVGAWMAFLLPLVVWLGWMWVLLIWTLAVFPYARRVERTLASLVLVWGIAAAPAFDAVASVFRTSVNPEVRTLVAALQGGYDPERLAYLKEAAREDPGNAVIQFLVGSLYRDGGFFNEALLHYKQAVQLDPRLFQAVNNLGNLYFNTQNFSLAQQQYQQAVDLRPDFWIGYFNLHLAQYQQFHVEDAEKNLETARRLDPEGIGLMRTAELPRTAIEARLSLEDVWPKLARSARDETAGVPVWKSPYALAAAGTLAGAHLFTGRRRRRARSCFKCGRPFCYRCRSGAQYPDYCSQCVHLFAKRDGLAPATKKTKLDEVQRYETRRRRLSRILSALAPGLGHVWADRAVLGFIGLGCWIFCLLALATHDRLLRFYQVAYADPRPVAGVAAIIGAVLVWALVNAVAPLRRS
jgi:tetratricopeptide (TPR) repeat protein